MQHETQTNKANVGKRLVKPSTRLTSPYTTKFGSAEGQSDQIVLNPKHKPNVVKKKTKLSVFDAPNFDLGISQSSSSQPSEEDIEADHLKKRSLTKKNE